MYAGHAADAQARTYAKKHPRHMWHVVLAVCVPYEEKIDEPGEKRTVLVVVVVAVVFVPGRSAWVNENYENPTRRDPSGSKLALSLSLFQGRNPLVYGPRLFFWSCPFTVRQQTRLK